jgi:DNA-directed RNA polymerase subunit RPC12/RpoP
MDKTYIKNCVQDILNKEFKSINRRRINDFSDRLNVCCPYCQDGKSEYKKRGNLYFNKLLYICFNCGKKTNFDKFTKDFNLRLDPSKKLEIIEHLNSQISFQDAEEDLMETELNKLRTEIEQMETKHTAQIETLKKRLETVSKSTTALKENKALNTDALSLISKLKKLLGIK